MFKIFRKKAFTKIKHIYKQEAKIKTNKFNIVKVKENVDLKNKYNEHVATLFLQQTVALCILKKHKGAIAMAKGEITDKMPLNVRFHQVLHSLLR